MLPHVRYLHGFGSGPFSEKGQDLGRRLADVSASFAIPDLEGGDFTGLTMEGMRGRAVAACPQDGRVILVGSSMGGYLAAWLAASGAIANLAGIVLIAPAFGFTSRWTTILGADGVAAWRRDGSRPFFHYGAQREVPLGVGFLDSCESVPAVPGDPRVPCAIVHGRGDETVDHRASLDFAASHPAVELHLVHGDHRLTEPRHAELIAWTARDLIARCGA
ncbi:MAG: alpha/beta fold hydrolase [Planctomycetes bacterium]|nr:alpha/beta fold hydrolase [Planctomycetota bacterium]